MKSVNSLISERLKKPTPTAKMTAMAERSASGQMTSFNGLFSVTELSESEKDSLLELLSDYAKGHEDLASDLKTLALITSEVKAINNQAALLHGERIKRVQTLLKRYEEGAFSAWLIATYGNRQTPYNLLQYYEFYEAIPAPLRLQLEHMPRQAVYALASREGAMDKKLEIIKKYQGETKQTLLNLIRDLFPLHEKDKRRQNLVEGALTHLEKARFLICKMENLPLEHKEALKEALLNLKHLVDYIPTR